MSLGELESFNRFLTDCGSSRDPDRECPHEHLPTDRRITCDCFGARSTTPDLMTVLSQAQKEVTRMAATAPAPMTREDAERIVAESVGKPGRPSNQLIQARELLARDEGPTPVETPHHGSTALAPESASDEPVFATLEMLRERASTASHRAVELELEIGRLETRLEDARLQRSDAEAEATRLTTAVDALEAVVA